MDGTTIAAICGAVVAVSTVANNFMSYRLQRLSAANGRKADAISAKIDHVHTCLEDHAVQIQAKIEDAQSNVNAVTVEEGNRHAA